MLGQKLGKLMLYQLSYSRVGPNLAEYPASTAGSLRWLTHPVREAGSRSGRVESIGRSMHTSLSRASS